MTESEGTNEIVLDDTISAGIAKVWDALIGSEGETILLGPGGQLGDKGDDWKTEDGHHGVMRSFHPREQLRFSWHAAAGDPATLVEVNLTSEGDDATHIELKHSKLPQGADADALRDEWEKKLDRIAGLAGDAR